MRKLGIVLVTWSVIMFFGCIYLFWKCYVLNSKVKSLYSIVKTEVSNNSSKNELTQRIQDLQLQQANTITLIEYQNNWTTTYVSILFVLFGIFGYSIFQNFIKIKFVELKKKLNNTYNLYNNKHEENYSIHDSKIEKIHEDIQLIAGNLYATIANTNQSTIHKFIYSFRSAMNFYNYYVNKPERMSTVLRNLQFSE